MDRIRGARIDRIDKAGQGRVGQGRVAGSMGGWRE